MINFGRLEKNFYNLKVIFAPIFEKVQNKKF